MEHQDVRLNSKLVDKNYKTTITKFQGRDAITIPSDMLQLMSLSITQVCALNVVFFIKECKLYTTMQPASYMYTVDGIRQMSCNFMHCVFQCKNVNILSPVNILCCVIAKLLYQVMLIFEILCTKSCRCTYYVPWFLV